MRQVRLTVRGQVQGVGFRWFVREAARRAGLAGWVRNLPDGSVEVVAHGDDESVATLERTVRVGPPGARIDAVQPEPVGPGETLPNPFTILR